MIRTLHETAPPVDLANQQDARRPVCAAARTKGRSLARLAVVAMAALLAACQSPLPRPDAGTTESGVRATGGRLLSGSEAQALLGKPQRYRWTTASGASGYTQVAAGGRIRTYWDSDAVNGRIRFTDSGYCTRYEGVRDNREDCYRIYRMAADQYRVFRLDGAFSGTIQLEP